MPNQAVPHYLKPKDTKLEAGPDVTLEPTEGPTDPQVRALPPNLWPPVDKSKGGTAPPDAALAPPPVNPLKRWRPPFEWPRIASEAVPNRALGELIFDLITLDPDIALWPEIVVSIWPFAGPPSTGVWPLGWFGIDNTGTPYVCTTGGAPGTWTAITLNTAVTTETGNLGSLFTVPTTLGTFLTTAQLSVGLWLVNVTGVVAVAPSNVVEIQANIGTAGGSFAGGSATEVQNPSTTVNLVSPFSLSFLATLGGAGTLVFQAKSGAGGSTIQAVTTLSAYPHATGYVASIV